MEPQGALVLPDEGGTFTVTSSTQSLDAVQKAVAETLGIPWHKVTAGQCLLLPDMLILILVISAVAITVTVQQ